MRLTPAQFARAATLEADQLRLMRLSRMSSGQLYALLNGDPVDAAVWVRSAAQCGVTAAQIRLGRMLLLGQGMPRDQRAAYLWFVRAADEGNEEAMNMAGRCHELGWGVPVDLSLAAVHYRSSALAGHDWGQYNFGNLLFDGRGAARDLQQAFSWYLRAASQGHARAMNLLGRCFEEGWGCRSDLEDAAGWYRRSAEAGYFRGQFNHADMLLTHGDVAAAARWFWAAALGGDASTRRAIVGAIAQADDALLIQVASQVRRLDTTQ